MPIEHVTIVINICCLQCHRPACQPQVVHLHSNLLRITRYAAELFYMAPLYHLAFTSLAKMIVIDATDLEFHESLLLLQEEMDMV